MSLWMVCLPRSVWWIGFVVFELGWVMGALRQWLRPKKKTNKQNQFKSNKREEREWTNQLLLERPFSKEWMKWMSWWKKRKGVVFVNGVGAPRPSGSGMNENNWFYEIVEVNAAVLLSFSLSLRLRAARPLLHSIKDGLRIGWLWALAPCGEVRERLKLIVERIKWMEVKSKRIVCWKSWAINHLTAQPCRS